MSAEAVKVFVRVRPFNKRERDGHKGDTEYPMSVIYMHGDKPKIDVLDDEGGVEQNFDYGQTFWSIPDAQNQICSKPFANQETVFQEMGLPAVQSSLDGYHVCIFAYGQTGSGKTYTMLGSVEDPGLAPRLVDELFERINNTKRKGWKYEVTLSFMEIYNEKVKDLLVDVLPSKKRESKRGSLSPSKKADEYQALRVRQDKTIGVHVEGLTRLGHAQGYDSAQKIKKVIRFGMEHRATAETKMNATSSRSHAIFQLVITARNAAKGITTYSHLNIVDLAGSERITMSGAQGSTLVEATRINLSLTTLRRVIDALLTNAKNKAKVVPPYRDSMLTYILSESLGGNSNTMMLATVSPSSMNREDTLNTLRYAAKAKEIVNVVRKNEKKEQANMGHFAAEIEALRQQLVEEDPDCIEYEEMKQEMALKEEEQNRHIAQAELEKARIEEAKLAMEEAHKINADLVEELKNKDLVEEEKRIIDKEHAEAEEKFDEIAELHRVASLRKRKADELLKHEEDVKQSLEDQKIEHIVQSAEVAQEIEMLKRKKFGLAFKKAFGMITKKSHTEELQEEVSELNADNRRLEKQLSELEADLQRELSNRDRMNIGVESANQEVGIIEAKTVVQEHQAEADALRSTNEKTDSENNRLLERLSELRVDIVGIERSKLLSSNRATSRISETQRRLETARQQRHRLKEHRNAACQSRDEIVGELSGTSQNKSKALEDYEARVKRKDETVATIKDLKQRNEALQMHLENHVHAIEAEVRRLRGLQCQHKPLEDEMNFSSMVLKLGYGRVASSSSGGRPILVIAHNTRATAQNAEPATLK